MFVSSLLYKIIPKYLDNNKKMWSWRFQNLQRLCKSFFIFFKNYCYLTTTKHILILYVFWSCKIKNTSTKTYAITNLQIFPKPAPLVKPIQKWKSKLNSSRGIINLTGQYFFNITSNDLQYSIWEDSWIILSPQEQGNYVLDRFDHIFSLCEWINRTRIILKAYILM